MEKLTGLGRSLSVKSHSSRKTSGSHSNRRQSSEMVEEQGPRPAEVLSARFTEWKHIVKALLAYFEGIVALENNHAKELGKLSSDLTRVVPLTESWQFLPDTSSGTPGWASGIHFVRDKNKSMGDHHTALAKAITTGVVDPLKHLRVEIKEHVKAVDEIRKVHHAVGKERDASVKSVQDLALGITKLQTTPQDVNVGEDPWIAKGTAVKQFHKQIDQENALTTLIMEFHKRSKILEERIASTLSTAMRSVQASSSTHITAITQEWGSISTRLATIPPLVEWEHFASLPETDEILLPADTPLRSYNIQFPHIDEPSAQPVFTGVLERKKRIMKSYKVAYYVLTPAGYLHEYKDSNEKDGLDTLGGNSPTLSLFLPSCTLGAATDRSAKEYKWHIEGRNSSSSGLKLGKGEQAHTFRAANYDDMIKWHDLMQKYAKNALQHKARGVDGGPGVSAVRGAGVDAEDDESGIESGEEEEEEEETVPATVAAASTAPPLPARSQSLANAPPGHASAVEEKAAIAAKEAEAGIPPVPRSQVTTSPDGTTTTITTIHFEPGSKTPTIETKHVQAGQAVAAAGTASQAGSSDVVTSPTSISSSPNAAASTSAAPVSDSTTSPAYSAAEPAVSPPVQTTSAAAHTTTREGVPSAAPAAQSEPAVHFADAKETLEEDEGEGDDEEKKKRRGGKFMEMI